MPNTDKPLVRDTSLVAAFLAIQSFLHGDEAAAAEIQLSTKLGLEDIRGKDSNDYEWFMQSAAARQIAIGVLLPPTMTPASIDKAVAYAAVAGNKHCSKGYYAVIVRATNTPESNPNPATRNQVVFELFAPGPDKTHGVKLPQYTKTCSPIANDATLRALSDELYQSMEAIVKPSISGATPESARKEPALQ